MRTPTKYTVVTIDDGELVAHTYANADAAKDALAKLDGATSIRVFIGEPVAFEISRTPTVILGKKERKPRGPNKKAKAKNGSTTGIVTATTPGKYTEA